MAIKPSEPAKGIGATEKAQPLAPTESAQKVSSVESAAQMQAAAKVSALSSVAGVSKSLASDRVASIADRLRRGVLTPTQAVEELIEDTVRSSLPGLTASSPLTQKLREILQSYAKEDPYLFAKVRRLSEEKE